MTPRSTYVLQLYYANFFFSSLRPSHDGAGGIGTISLSSQEKKQKEKKALIQSRILPVLPCSAHSCEYKILIGQGFWKALPINLPSCVAKCTMVGRIVYAFFKIETQTRKCTNNYCATAQNNQRVDHCTAVSSTGRPFLCILHSVIRMSKLSLSLSRSLIVPLRAHAMYKTLSRKVGPRFFLLLFF